MMTKKWIVPLLLMMAAFVVGACSLLPGQRTVEEGEQLNTVVAQTVQAELTSAVLETALAKSTQLPTQQVDTATPQPSATNQPTLTASPYPTSTPKPVPCLGIQFVMDVTIPDGTMFAPGTSFVKTWRLRNAGSCTWTPDYSLVFRGGNAMGASGVVYLNSTVYPGQNVDVSVTLTAPAATGTYEGLWSLRSPNGVLFALGDNADVPFWVKIVTMDAQATWPASQPLDFAANFCSAMWVNEAGLISCPSTFDDFNLGSVYRTFDPKIEDNYQDDEITLVVIPSAGTVGVVSGRYPAVTVQNGDRFQALVGCMDDMDDCDVTFRLKYMDGSGIHTLGSWHEVYEGMHTRIDVDLSGLAGQQVQFILEVDNNDSSYEDKVFWMAPHIKR
jgi:Ig-like domain-containing protein